MATAMRATAVALLASLCSDTICVESAAAVESVVVVVVVVVVSSCSCSTCTCIEFPVFVTAAMVVPELTY